MLVVAIVAPLASGGVLPPLASFDRNEFRELLQERFATADWSSVEHCSNFDGVLFDGIVYDNIGGSLNIRSGFLPGAFGPNGCNYSFGHSDRIRLTFPPGIHAVGVPLWQGINSYPPGNATFGMVMSNGFSIARTEWISSTDQEVFIGVISDEQIEWIEFWRISSDINVVWRWFAFDVSGPDCNGDGIVDYGQVLDGTFADTNANGVPDTCECFADVNQDGVVNGADISAVLGFWGLTGKPLPAVDITRDGIVDGADLAVLLGSWGPCQ